jgi:hypothetical protein
MGLDMYAYMALLTSHTLVGKMGKHQSDSDVALDWDGDNQALVYVDQRKTNAFHSLVWKCAEHVQCKEE